MSYDVIARGPVGEMVREEIVRRLGREPQDRTEYALLKSAVLQANPGIGTQLLREEKHGTPRRGRPAEGRSDAHAGAALIDSVAIAVTKGSASNLATLLADAKRAQAAATGIEADILAGVVNRVEALLGQTLADAGAPAEPMGKSLDQAVATLRTELQTPGITPAQRAALQQAITDLSDHVAPGNSAAPVTAKSAGPLRGMVHKTVVDHLGREPISKLEEVQIRKQIYDANPGLQQAAMKEERAQRSRGD